MNAPYRASAEEPPPPTYTTTDPAETAMVEAINDLRRSFRDTITLLLSRHENGTGIGNAAHGFGTGIAKIGDALVRLRQQKLGGTS